MPSPAPVRNPPDANLKAASWRATQASVMACLASAARLPAAWWPGATRRIGLPGLLLMLLAAPAARADTLTVAVASNFADTLASLVPAFEQQSGHQIRLVRGSSGRHFAQIVNGAPFDLFLSADAERPAQLLERLALPADRLHTYAQGRLVLWSPQQTDSEAIEHQLRSRDFQTLAIANPRLAPYGQAAVDTLHGLGLADLLEAGDTRLVRGENIAQTYQYVASGNADLGFVALSQVLATDSQAFWLVPESLYTPITQQLVILQDTAAARALLAFLASAPARTFIEAAGYRLP